MSLLPHQFWQTVDPAGSHASPAEGWVDSYPVSLPDGRQVLLPIRVLPGDGTAAVASLIINQASFAVEDAISAALADLLRPFSPDVIIGVPTLGLPLANNVARRLGHGRMVALGTSRKFWYRDELSAPMSSITSPNQQKTLFLDPRSLPLLEDKRIAVIDDVISSGTSMAAALNLLGSAGLKPVAIGAAMLQGTRWHDLLGEWKAKIVAPLASPRLGRIATGHWQQI
ncbi:phosphoribosyltransferase [Devosia aurantiaca]|uniref:Phosphoribosyltransferase n=1 Tax=Devosia aurantiaca TaxID=2714858 RepID=A0A6M1SWX5_9HYPH|nr:phosphoribosyltransferase [Devosia aurantiaca]NGP17351.1 phosphoribosyltransferase [Devosia aurantiaca]